MNYKIKNIDNEMSICRKNKIVVSHSYNKDLKKYIIEVYFNGVLSKSYKDNPVNPKDLNESVQKTWIFYAKKL